jgi:hypothetical protein
MAATKEALKMFRLVYQHIMTKDTLANKEYLLYLANGEIYTPANWQPVLVLFGRIKIKL